MKKRKISVAAFMMILLMPGFLTSVFSLIPSETYLMAKTGSTEIDVRAGDTYAGNGMGSFDTVYNGKKMEVLMYWNEVKVYKNNKKLSDVSSPFFPYDTQISQKGPISGKTVKVIGIWKSPNSFKATEIYIK
jgi:hypothetical protein